MKRYFWEYGGHHRRQLLLFDRQEGAHENTSIGEARDVASADKIVGALNLALDMATSAPAPEGPSEAKEIQVDSGLNDRPVWQRTHASQQVHHARD